MGVKQTKWKSIYFLSAIFISFIVVSNFGKEVRAEMKLTSPNFENQGDIPQQFTCDGKDISPALSWSGAPEGTKSFALIVDDPDAPDPKNPKMTWVHWVIYNIPSTADSIPEAVTEANLPKGTMQGLNDWKKTGYGGPCPPIGKHRYFHKLYALDTELPDLQKPTKDELLNAMKGYVLEETELIGLYSRK
jgi:Raf kinase inhibitor-like YbhB/YbcL family protein